MEDHLIRIDPERNTFRFYRLAPWSDLFGGMTLAREWGRIGSPGQICLERFADEEQAAGALARLAAAKRRRGYREAA